MLIMLSYEMMLKNKLIEGNYQEELYKSLDNLDYNRPTLELPLDKMTLIMEKILEKITGDGGFKKGKECKGEFVINKLTNKTCGDGFNEKVYKILDKGDGDCLHSELYKEKVPLKPCEYAEKCEKDLDCKSNKCKEGICDIELDCSETMLSGCGYDSCLALNDGLDKDLYYWYDGECNVNPCNENTYEKCDEGGCEDLSYRFEYNKELKICEEIIDEQGEETRRLDSMEEQYDRYITEGGYDNVCKPNDFETCEVSPNLEPRYYCNEPNYKKNGAIDGDSNHCIECVDDWELIRNYLQVIGDESDINCNKLMESYREKLKVSDTRDLNLYPEDPCEYRMINERSWTGEDITMGDICKLSCNNCVDKTEVSVSTEVSGVPTPPTPPPYEASSWLVELQEACSDNQQECFNMCENVAEQNPVDLSTCPIRSIFYRTITANDLCDQKCATNLVPYVRNCRPWLRSERDRFLQNLINFADNKCR